MFALVLQVIVDLVNVAAVALRLLVRRLVLLAAKAYDYARWAVWGCRRCNEAVSVSELRGVRVREKRTGWSEFLTCDCDPS